MSAAAQSRALEALSDITELLKLTQAAVSRVRRETHGDAYEVAERMSGHLQYLSQVNELLRHEVERHAREAGCDTRVPDAKRPSVAFLGNHADRAV